MSRENMERLRQGLGAFNRRDRAGWLAFVALEAAGLEDY